MKYCKNCGIYGHNYKECNNPILSYGILLFRKNGDKPEILMIERKDTICYTEFIRGRYNINDEEYIKLLISRFSNNEKINILKYDFDKLWKDLWIDLTTINKKIKEEYHPSKLKFKKLIDNNKLKEIIKNDKLLYKENEWEFPKGRRNNLETNLECAKREFQEETDLDENHYQLYKNIIPFIEEYTSTNNVRYKSCYYIGRINDDNKEIKLNKKNKNQCNEIKNIRWVTNDTIIRDYQLLKKNIFNKVLQFIKLLDTNELSII